MPDTPQALEIAEDFSCELHQRVKAGGFIKTLLQRRVGSSVVAGLKTAKRMLVEREIEDEEGLVEEGNRGGAQGSTRIPLI